jgi:hypothetical protein
MGATSAMRWKALVPRSASPYSPAHAFAMESSWAILSFGFWSAVTRCSMTPMASSHMPSLR